MRKLALLLAAAIVAASPTIAFAKSARHHRVARPAPQSFRALNQDTLKFWHDMFVWPSS